MAVVFPIFVLAYCYTNFQLDRAVLLLNIKNYPPGSFELLARLSSNPQQTALFRLIFDSLRIQSLPDFLLRMSMNLSLCYRFKRVAEIVIEKQRQLMQTTYKQAPLTEETDPTVVSQHSLPRPVAMVLLLFSIPMFASTCTAVTASQSLCIGYPNCAAYAYRWFGSGSSSNCPCIALIDVEEAPKTYAEWVSPRNVSDEVAQLAASGYLRILQLINRHFVDWPDELQRCTNLQHV